MRIFASSASPVLGELSCLYVGNRAGMAEQPEGACQVTGADRGWPGLARAGGRPGLDLALAGRAGGAKWPKPQGGLFSIDRASCSSSHCRIATRSYTWPSTVLT